MPDLSIIIVSWNVRDYLLACIDSVIKTTRDTIYEIIVVDNNSSDGTANEVVRVFPSVKLIRNPVNSGFAGGNNLGFRESRGRHILLLNSDTVVKPGAIDRMAAEMDRHERCAVLGCRILNPDGTLQYSVHQFPSIARNIRWALRGQRVTDSALRTSLYYASTSVPVDSVGGACMLVRRSAVMGDNVLNEAYFMYSEEIDLSLVMRKNGWTTMFTPLAEIIHHGGQSTALAPNRMFLEVQWSQVKLYRAHYQGWYRAALLATWWLVLISGTAGALLTAGIKKDGLKRFRLFGSAAVLFPYLIFKKSSARVSDHVNF